VHLLPLSPVADTSSLQLSVSLAHKILLEAGQRKDGQKLKFQLQRLDSSGKWLRNDSKALSQIRDLVVQRANLRALSSTEEEQYLYLASVYRTSKHRPKKSDIADWPSYLKIAIDEVSLPMFGKDLT